MTATGATTLDVKAVRADFPIMATTMRGEPLVYLDSAASAQKPKCVLDAMSRFYQSDYANVHRGVYQLSERATTAYEEARRTVADFMGAASPREIIFTRNATEGINLVAQTFGRANLGRGDEVLVTEMEHHANIVPWQMLCEQTGATLRVARFDDRGELLLEDFERWLSARTRIVAIGHVSNALGTINPVARLAEMAHAHGAVVVVDGAQTAPHMAIDVQALGADFYVITGHKIFGPTGIGALYGRLEWLESMPPYQGGGDMIETVSFERTTYAPAPAKFEAGTPDIAGAIGLAEAIRYLSELGLDAVAAHEQSLLAYATAELEAIPGLRIFGTAAEKAAVISFELDNAHPHDIGTILDTRGIAIRAGHHCAQPVMKHFGVPATARASFSIYNTREDVDALSAAVREARELFG